MHSVAKYLGALAIATILCAFAIPAYVYLASEALIERRYPLPTDSGFGLKVSIARGEHLARIAGCADCHATDLEGRHLNRPAALRPWSSNLRLEAARMTDAEFERALRHGIAPDATSLWAMPSPDYAYIAESDVAALYAYLRALGPAGALRPRPVFSRRARLALLDGQMQPAALAVREAPTSLDMGPRYDGGRYLARISCSECHGTDLDGVPAQGAPDLDSVALYTRPAFFDLLRRGIGVGGHRIAMMHRLAAARFRFFADYEIMALYDYLTARAHASPALVARARANEARRRAATAAEGDD
ncbi:MAG: c-type cytochrome [Rhizomicrobium sp.]